MLLFWDRTHNQAEFTRADIAWNQEWWAEINDNLAEAGPRSLFRAEFTRAEIAKIRDHLLPRVPG